MTYRFFFSYASETYRSAAWKNWGTSGNYLEEFYDDLCRHVAEQSAEKAESVAYRDEERLKVADFWKGALVDALQQSHVLISIISPHYLASQPCGREVEFFRRRFGLLCQAAGPQTSHRVIPVFWIGHPQCTKHMSPKIKDFFDDLQRQQKGMTSDYPNIGVHTSYLLGDMPRRNKILQQLGERICELCEMLQLPILANNGDFSKLPSFFRAGNRENEAAVASGPTGTNVVYAVATKEEMSAEAHGPADVYAERREACRPFPDAKGATIEAATKEGLDEAGQVDSEYRNIGMPEDLVVKLRQAKQSNSPVLIVLDRSSLRINVIEHRLRQYDDFDSRHVGLVTAAGTDKDETLVLRILPIKYTEKRANHLWTIPDGRNAYVRNVVDVIGGLKKGLQQTGTVSVTLPASPLPGIASTLTGGR